MRYNERGEEIHDGEPVPIPAHLQGSVDRFGAIKAYVRSVLSMQADEAGTETFEEADDFDVDEDPDPLSRYEFDDAAPEWPGGVKDVDGDPPTDPREKTAPRGSNAAGKGRKGVEVDSDQQSEAPDAGGRGNRRNNPPVAEASEDS